jgi:hypothetical protein
MSGDREPPEQPQFVQRQQEADEAERQRQIHQENLTSINSIADQLEISRQHQDANDKDKSFREKLTIGLLVATVAVTLLTLMASEINAVIQHRDSNQALHAAYVAMKQQRADTKEALHRADVANQITRISARQAHADNISALQAAKDANAASVTSANAQERLTRASNAISKEAFTAVQRAFIVVDQLGSADVYKMDGTTKTFAGEYFFPLIQNSGNTPATIIRAVLITPHSRMYGSDISDANWRKQNFASFKVRAPVDPASLLDSGSESTVTHIQNAVLGPKGMIQPIEGQGSDTIFLNDAFRANRGSFGPYFFGAIEYFDIFNVKHIEKYCFSTNNAMIAGGTGTHVNPIRCSHWNCADKQCDADKEDYDAEVAAVKPEEMPGEDVHRLLRLR